MTNQFVTGKVVGTGSTLLLLARNKEQLEVKKESLSHLQMVIYCMSGNQGDGQRSKAWTSCGGYIYHLFYHLDSVLCLKQFLGVGAANGPLNCRQGGV